MNITRVNGNVQYGDSMDGRYCVLQGEDGGRGENVEGGEGRVEG